MQPKRQIRMQDDQQKPNFKKKVRNQEINFELELEKNEFLEVQRLFRKGSATQKALEQTFLFSEGLMYKEPEEDQEEE